ncbi:hypothetical protein N7508_001356 [Penicillium antarcticum]|uniref:uncharacterized protein n=1 Tax=Penicillium antarcticum TaxID=416450 RepID=UPI002386813B|nr:uncharacterized protein N7508_001356 [Penicillium antarcticum]KAJ5316848.1 hypothetical protein N7508_001356 [Penicillium antarcticum]
MRRLVSLCKAEINQKYSSVIAQLAIPTVTPGGVLPLMRLAANEEGEFASFVFAGSHNVYGPAKSLVDEWDIKNGD